MPPAYNVDIKLSFPQFDMTPGSEGRKFRRNLLLHGGKADAHGFSLADCLLRLDAHAVQRGQPIAMPPPAGVLAAPGAPAPPAAGQPLVTSRQLRRARLKESFRFMVAHISDEAENAVLGDDAGPYFQNGPEAFDYVMEQVILALTTSEIQEMTMEFWLVEIISDVGISKNSIKDALKLLRYLNSEFPVASRFSDDDIAAKILKMITRASAFLATEAKQELDAAEGVPGQPGVRRFQRPVPPAGGPRPRNLNTLVDYFHGQWKDAVDNKRITPAPATGQAGKTARRHSVDSARMVTDRALALGGEFERVPLAPAVRGSSPSRTLGELTDAGYQLTRGTVTSTDWRLATPRELARSVEDGDGGEEYVVEVCFDADGNMSIEMLCICCGGAGHPARLCASAKRYRSHAYLISLHQNAQKRKDERGERNYGAAPGGRRPPPRGQRPPFKAMPRRFNKSTPFRQFRPAASSSKDTGRSADEGEQASSEDEESATEGAGGAVEHELPPEAAKKEGAASAGEKEGAMDVGAAEREAMLSREMPRTFSSPFSSEGYYSDSGHKAREVELPASTGAPVCVDAPPGWLEHKPLGLKSSALSMMDDEPEGAKPRQWPGQALATGLVLLVGLLMAMLWERVSACMRTVTAWAVEAAPAGVGVLVTLPPAAVVMALLFVLMGRVGAVPVAVGAQLELPFDASFAITDTNGLAGIDVCRMATPRRMEGAAIRPLPPDQDDEDFWFCMDSGCTCVCVPEEDGWMVDEITDPKPNRGVEVASATVLPVLTIGKINSKQQPTLVCDSFSVDANGREIPTVSAPSMSRVLVTRGLKKGTRLVGVRPVRLRDKINSYFNEDNSAGIGDCVRLADGCYVRFEGEKHEIRLRRPRAGELPERSRPCPVELARVGVAKTREPIEIHAALGHCSDKRIREAKISMGGVDLRSFHFDAAQCPGCRLGKTQEAPRRGPSTAPSKGVPSARYYRSTPQPSTTGYTYFGQRFDTDLCTSMPASWPHGFTTMMNFCDRYSAEFMLFFLVQRTSGEVASSMADLERRCQHRLKDGRVTRWHTDGDLAFEGSAVKEAAEELITRHTRSPPNASNKNPVAERNFGTLEPGIRATLAYCGERGAPECLWPWAAAHLEKVLYYMPTRAHYPPTSAYHFTHPEAGEADLSWADVLFCDVTVHLTERDIKTKTGPTGADGCFLGHDFERNCSYVYVPSLQRLGSFTVTSWRLSSFTICQMISADTPVEYRQLDDLRFSPLTASFMPRQMRAARAPGLAAATAAEKEGVQVEEARLLLENASHIEAGVRALEKEGVEAFQANVVKAVRSERAAVLNDPPVKMSAEWSEPKVAAKTAEHARLLGLEKACTAADERLLFGEAGAGEFEVEIVLHGNDVARKVAVQYGIPKIRTVKEAMESQYWPLIREAMEEEIAGKLANKAFTCVPRGEHRVMRSKWVIDFKLNEDGSILKVKARFVGCGYSQVEEIDFDKTYAATLPGCCLRLWCSVVADEDLETDNIDAVKAFTQSPVDRELYVDMPIGFQVPGYVLKLHKALEGIRQGSYLWFQHNKWAWNKCGMFADLIEPNLYTHEVLVILAAVFADDVGAAFKKENEAEYLALRAAYGKLINIDCVSPDVVVPVTKFTGVNISRDRSAGTLSISMGTYIRKLRDRRPGVVARDMPTAKSKAARTAFENMQRGTEETMIDRTTYLEALGEVAWPAAMAFPELVFYTSSLGQHSQHPQQEHLDAVFYAMGYLFSDPDRAITYGGALKVPFGLTEMPPFFIQSRGFYTATDSSWGTKPRPHGGHAVFRCNAVIHWSSRQLKVVCDSSAHAETAEASRAVKDAQFLGMALSGIKRPAMGPHPVLGDSSAMHDLVTKEGSSSRSRHFERATVLIKYAVLKLMAVCYLVGTKFMSADVFTKATDEWTFKTMRAVLRNEPRSDAFGLRALAWMATAGRVSRRRWG